MRVRLTKTQSCLAVAALTLVVGAGDYLHTRNQVPELPPLCPSSPASGPVIDACWEARNAEVDLYADRKGDLVSGLEDRLDLYGAVIGVALLLAVLFSVPEDPARRRRYFANVGTAGAALLIGIAILALYLSNSSLDIGSLGLFFPAFAVIGAAAAGGIVAFAGSTSAVPAAAPTAGARAEGARLTGRAEPGDPRLRALVRALPLMAIAFGVLTVVFLSSWSQNQPACYSSDPEPASAHTMNVLGTIAYFGTLGAAVGLLINRRWFIALAVILVTTAFAFVAALGVAFRCD
jgi:hypothetical protein